MQKVSKAYKESMKSSLRERAYIMISFGLVNQEAQAKATVDNGSYAYYSNKDNIFGEHIDDTVYATLEEEFTKVDGSMFFLPRATEGGRYYDTGIVSDKLVSEARCEVIISLNTIATDFKGLTINFGENYPVDFDIVGSTGQTIEFRGNTKSKWSTEEVLENTTYIKLVFYKMKNPQSRLRIYSIMFGYGLVYTPTDGTMFFLPRNGKAALTTGYVSKEISGANGTFTKNPVVTITMEAIRAYYGLKLVFGTALPAAFTIRTYKGGEPVNEYPVEKDEINTTSIILRDFDDFDVMKIEFTKTAEPYNRIVLNYFSLSDVVDFTMNRRDMTSSPKAIKQELIKEVIVPCYTYQENNREENLVYEDIDVVAGEVETYYIQDPSYGYKVKLDEVEGKATVVAWSNYFVTIKFNVTGSFKLEVQGYRYKIVEKYATVSLNARGKTVKWKNPLISNTTMANELAAWLADYYTAGIEYEYDTRGNPELDATDIVYQENEFHDGMRVNIYRHTVNFKQAFSGRVTARRIGG